MLMLPGATAATSYNLADYITNDEKAVVTNDYEIYGNIDGMSTDDFNAIVNDGEDKVYLHYRTDRNIDLSYDAQLCVKAFGKVHSFEFIEQERSDADFIKVGIKSFINLCKQKIDELQQGGRQKTAVANSSVPTTFINCSVDKNYMIRFDKRGYIWYHVAAAQYDANNTSQLYIATVRSTFVSGSVAKKHGDNSYGNYKNKSGDVHMTVEQAYDATEADLYGSPRYGGETYRKDYWPLNVSGVVTINSSVQTNLSFGRSFKNGFSTDGISVSQDDSVALNVSYGYSKSYTMSDPSIIAQPSSSNDKTVQWGYTFAEKHGRSDVSNDLETNYMFELSNIKNSLLKGDFRLKLDFMFETYWVATRKVDYSSADLFVGAGLRQEIRPFSNGML